MSKLEQIQFRLEMVIYDIFLTTAKYSAAFMWHIEDFMNDSSKHSDTVKITNVYFAGGTLCVDFYPTLSSDIKCLALINIDSDSISFYIISSDVSLKAPLGLKALKVLQNILYENGKERYLIDTIKNKRTILHCYFDDVLHEII